MRTLTLSLLAALVVACAPPAPPVPPPGPDAADAAGPAPVPSTPCQAACSRLETLGCPEGTADDCAVVLAHVEGDRLVRTSSGDPLTCAAVAAASDVTAERTLGVCLQH